MKPRTDKEILDWLSKQTCVSFERHFNSFVDTRTKKEIQTDGYNGHIDFFSCSSQHIENVPSLRAAVTKAMRRCK